MTWHHIEVLGGGEEDVRVTVSKKVEFQLGKRWEWLVVFRKRSKSLYHRGEEGKGGGKVKGGGFRIRETTPGESKPTALRKRGRRISFDGY